MKIEVTNIEFDSMEAFIQWKEDIESSTHSSYVLKCAPTISNEAKVSYYYCNTACVYKPDGKGKRHLKTQGIAKIGCQCTAHLQVYYTRLHDWATCYRVGSTVNTNMFLEAFHRVLKMVYLHHKQNRCVDSLLVVLIKIVRNMAFERMRKLEMEKNSHRICEIMKRHQSANKLLSTSITPINNKKWKVNSQNVQDTRYVVEKLEKSCDCKVICHDCQICPHAYTCTCLDATLHATICKHVHLVHMNTSNHFFFNERTSSDMDYLYFVISVLCGFIYHAHYQN